MIEKERYDELVKRVRNTHEYYNKMRRKIMNEPESEIKYEKLELMNLMMNRSAEIVNWWNNYEAKILNREKHKKEMQKCMKKKANKEKVDKYIAETISPSKTEQDWNIHCKFYNQDSYGDRTCSCGMDMTFCSKKCAYASNVVGSTPVYK